MNKRRNTHICSMHFTKRSTFVLLIIFLAINHLRAQSTYIPLGSSSMHMIDRFEILSGRLAEPQEFNTSTKAYKRSSIAKYVDSFDVSHTSLSKQDFFNLDYLQNDNFEYSKSENTKSLTPVLKNKIYAHKAAFADYDSKDFEISINPIAYLQYGYDTRLKEAVYINNRGAEIRGSIKGVVSFYTQFSDEILQTNSWVRDYYQKDSVIPGAGFLKTTNNKNFNYELASGYINFQISKFIDVQFGRGKNFLGNGYRSFYMSDFSVDNLFLRINTRVWKINYTNIFGQILDYTTANESHLPKRHYYATTHASINITKKFNFGLFQTVILQRDSGYSNTGFEAQYLNPIIFYKPIENDLNSPDKALLGADFKYNFAHHFSLYGQVVISEFVLSEVRSGKGWWANKQAYQLGIKYIDVLNVKNLDLQLEYNQANPYMYTSFSSLNTWVNYHQNMAHPLGANFRELVGVIRYQPMNRLFLKGIMILSLYGNDTNNSNWGKNIGLSYHSRQNDYGNFIGQGIKTQLYFLDLTVSYMVKHNMFIDLQLAYRKTSSDMSIFETETFVPSLAFRWNISERRYDF